MNTLLTRLRQSERAVSVLELLAYIVIAAALILAAWFGLNSLLSKGDESRAEQNLYSSAKIAKTAAMADSQRQFPNKAQLVNHLNQDGLQAVAIDSYSELEANNDRILGVLTAGGNQYRAGIRMSSSRIKEVISEIPGLTRVADITDGSAPDPEPELVNWVHPEAGLELNPNGGMFQGSYLTGVWYNPDCQVGDTCQFKITGTKSSSLEITGFEMMFQSMNLGTARLYGGMPFTTSPHNLSEKPAPVSGAPGQTTFTAQFSCQARRVYPRSEINNLTVAVTGSSEGGSEELQIVSQSPQVPEYVPYYNPYPDNFPVCGALLGNPGGDDI